MTNYCLLLEGHLISRIYGKCSVIPGSSHSTVWLIMCVLVCNHNTSLVAIMCQVILMESFDILNFIRFFHPSMLALLAFVIKTKEHS